MKGSDILLEWLGREETMSKCNLREAIRKSPERIRAKVKDANWTKNQKWARNLWDNYRHGTHLQEPGRIPFREVFGFEV